VAYFQILFRNLPGWMSNTMMNFPRENRCHSSASRMQVRNVTGDSHLEMTTKKSSVSWGMTPCFPVEIHQRFGGTCMNLCHILKECATHKWEALARLTSVSWSSYSWLYCHAYAWLYTEFGLVIGFIELLQNVTASNYSTIANSHTQQFTTTCHNSSDSAVSLLAVAW
jgi:hypothetical protein